MKNMQALKRGRDLLYGSASILLSVGIIMIYSASAIYAHDKMRDSAYYLKRHLVYLLLGCFLARIAASVDYERLRKYSKHILIGTLVFMVLVLIPHVGYSTGGARRWFRILGFSFQPSEFLKIALIFYLADFLERKRLYLKDLKRTVFPVLVVLGISVGLVFLQPDLGTAITIAVVAMILFFASGFSVWHLGVMVLGALPVLYVALLSKPYRKKRLLAFFHPWDDPRGVGFQIIQSFLALGSGGIFGVGLGRSQQKLFYLPESHTDFIFSIIGEELGFIGAFAVVILFVLFIFAGMVIAYRAKDFFSQLLALGLVSLVGFEAVINIGVSIGALPTKGLSLPFISYGGTALLANLVIVGILMNISRKAMIA
jgi:cell division protein FtsW